MKLKESAKGVLGIILLYLIVIIGIVLINARLGSMQEKAVAETTASQTLSK